MINGKRIAVVMPAYNAEKTLEKTVQELSDIVDIKILVDDSSRDQTAALSRKLGVQTFIHDANYGYGRNQQTCYREALAAGADIVVMVHPDYQYTPLLVPAMAGMIAGFRASVLGGAFPAEVIVISSVAAVVMFVAGVRYFLQVERRFADVI